MQMPDRRRFLQVSAALAAGGAAAPLVADEPKPAAKPAGPNEVVRVALVGVRGRGLEHLAGYAGLHDARITAICDADENVIGKAMRGVEIRYGGKPKYVQDIRRLLEDPEIDAVSIATPNHWHSLMSIWACQAGKHVYVEKPVSHNVVEGRRMVEAARKYDRVVQTGTQCRSNRGMVEAIDFIKKGNIGKVYMARGLCYRWRPSIGHKPVGDVPKGLDFDLWTGPAALKPYNPNTTHYNWHWVWNTGNGDLGNQGIHQMDIARWGLGKQTFPNTVQSTGGRFAVDDDAETPNTQSVAMEFDDCLLQFEVRGLPTPSEAEAKVGVIFYGSTGVVAITSYTDWQSYRGEKLEKGPGGRGGGDHFGNFVAAVKAGKRDTLAADIEEGHLSSAYCHLGNIAYKLGRKLHIKPGAESFVDDSEADAMLTRQYRAPFVVPDKV